MLHLLSWGKEFPTVSINCRGTERSEGAPGTEKKRGCQPSWKGLATGKTNQVPKGGWIFLIFHSQPQNPSCSIGNCSQPKCSSWWEGGWRKGRGEEGWQVWGKREGWEARGEGGGGGQGVREKGAEKDTIWLFQSSSRFSLWWRLPLLCLCLLFWIRMVFVVDMMSHASAIIEGSIFI